MPKKSSWPSRRHVGFIISAAILLIVGLAYAARISFRYFPLNLVAGCLAYTGYAFLATAGLLKPGVLWKLSGGLLSIPLVLLPAIAINYWLVVMFVVGDYETPTMFARQFPDGLQCQVLPQGMAVNGYDLATLEKPLFAGLYVTEESVKYPGEDPTSPEAMCARLHESHSSHR